MSTSLKYSDILNDILQKKHSKCICPSEYLSSLYSSKQLKTRGCCNISSNCAFCPDVTTSTTYPANPDNFDQPKCTCGGLCICGYQFNASSLTPKPERTGTLAQGNCTCVGFCICNSEGSSTSSSFIKSPTDNQAFYGCFCQPEKPPSGFLPSCLRNVIKNDMNTLDEKLQKDSMEIKQLLAEYEKNKIRESEPFSSPINLDKETRLGRSVSIKTDTISSKSSSMRKDEYPISTQLESVSRSPETVAKFSYKDETVNEPFIPAGDNTTGGKSGTKEVKIGKKEKKNKRRRKSLAKTNIISSYCGCRSFVKNVPKIRYHYSGDTKHYGVKLGHKSCLGITQQVPKHMGWLWNIEDLSKGLKERQGWPPGSIGKNIKDMIKVVKKMQQKPIQDAKTASMEGPGMQGESELFPSKKGFIPAEFEEAPPKEEPPLLYVHKKGRICNIVFCPRESDEDIDPVPIPFTITEKKRDSCSDTTESTLDFELYSPKPPGPPRLIRKLPSLPPQDESRASQSSRTKSNDKKIRRKENSKTRSTPKKNKIHWEEQQTEIQSVT